MIEINKQAEELNNVLLRDNPVVFDLLSEKGKLIFFPKSGLMSQSAQAKGKDINATIGIAINDDKTPMNFKSIADNVKLDVKDVFPYASSFGKIELRETWREKIYKKNPSLNTEISLPIVTNALTHGIMVSAYMFLDAGEKIILGDLFWGNYKLILQNGFDTEFSMYSTFKNGKFNTAGFDEKMSEEKGKKVVIFNFPNNPTGYTLTNDEAEEIKKIVLKHANQGEKILIICDDAYFGLVYKDGVYKESLFSIFANLHENVVAVKIDGATKEDFAWGLRVGFITFGSKGLTKDSMSVLEDKSAGVVRSTVSNVSNLSQSLVLKAFLSKDYQEEKEKNVQILKSRFHKVEKILQDNKYKKYFKPYPFNSGYFMCIELNKEINSEAVRQKLLNKYDTGIIAIGSIFRIAYSAIREDQIETIFENIYECCED